MLNPALLKLELIAYGIHTEGEVPRPLANPFGLVHLVLPESTAVSVHEVKSETPFTLLKKKDKFYLRDSRRSEKEFSISWTPPLQSYQKKTSSGVLVSDILTVHGGYIAVHPKGACRFGMSGLSCRYCGSTRELYRHPAFTKKDLIEAVEIVLKEKKCEFLNLSSGRVETEDGGVKWLKPWVEEIRRHLDILISLDLVPPKTNDWIDETYAMGVDALYYDLDFFNPLEMESTQKFQQQEERHLEALAYAAKIFPKGAVLSHVVVGLEPVKETKKKVDLLLELGVVPVLAYFPPDSTSNLVKVWKVEPKELTSLYAHLFEGLAKTKNTPHWVQQQDVVLTPLEGRFFSIRSPGFHLALKEFYQTSFGRSLRRSLVGVRRRLKGQRSKTK